VIRSFRNKALRRYAESGDASRLSVPNVRRLARLLNQLQNAARPEDMNLPGYRFHGLKGDRAGTYAVDVSGNYRLTFAWSGNDAIDVDLEDYH
jgi:proteic killer suppression protein